MTEYECIECGDELANEKEFADHMDEHNAIAIVNDEEPTYYEVIGLDDFDAVNDR